MKTSTSVSSGISDITAIKSFFFIVLKLKLKGSYIIRVIYIYVFKYTIFTIILFYYIFKFTVYKQAYLFDYQSIFV